MGNLLTESERKGLLLEKQVDQAFEKLNYSVDSNPFDPSEWKKSVGNGTDHWNNEIRIEDKNYNPCYPITPKIARKEILSRFSPKGIGGRKRILVIPGQLSHSVLELLERSEVHIVFLPYQVSEENFEKMIKILMSRMSVLLNILHDVSYNPLGLFILNSNKSESVYVQK